MPLPGGASDKLGNVYEATWTACKLLELLNGYGQSIWLEPAHADGKGVEFILTRADRTREFHQAKRQHSGDGAWTTSRLHTEKILSNFLDKLKSEPTCECVFVSASSADVLRELTERARKARDLTDFSQNFIHDITNRSGFEELRKKWNDCSEQDAFAFLNRIKIETGSEQILTDYAARLAANFIDAEPITVVKSLAFWSMESVNGEVTAQSVWDYLEKVCNMRRVPTSSISIPARIKEINQAYADQVQPYFILGSPLPRTETDAVTELVFAETAKRVIVLSGEAGTGKSGVVYATQKRLEEQGWLTLAFRLDRLHDAYCITARQLGQKLDLPSSPVFALTSLAAGKSCALIIDQLDAVSKVSGRRAEVFDAIAEILRQSEPYPNLRVILACRQFDLQNDDRFRVLVDPEGRASIVLVGGISQETIVDVVTRCGADAGRLSEQQKRLLANPLHLKLFTEVVIGAGPEAAFHFKPSKIFMTLTGNQSELP